MRGIPPTQVPGLTDVAAIAAGTGHAMALRTDGSVWAWGYNLSGQLGDGTTVDRFTPAPVAGLQGATAVWAGNDVAFALLSNGEVHAWGGNARSRIGDGWASTHALPSNVLPPASIQVTP
ncbi:RCC1 domain-containing protein [Cystobacter fuscus]